MHNVVSCSIKAHRTQQSDQAFYRIRSMNAWIMRRLRAIIWKHWKNRRTRIRELEKRGTYHDDAVRAGCARKGAWRMSRVKWVVMALPNAYFKSLGLYLLS